MKHLSLVVAAFFPDSFGGAERQAQILADALSKQGWTVTIFAPTLTRAAPAREITRFGEVRRLYVRQPPSYAGRHWTSWLKWTAWTLHQLVFAARGRPIYVFHARLHAAGPVVAAYVTGVPFLIKLGGGGEGASDFDALRSKKFLYGRLVEWLLLRRTDAFVANSHQIVSDLTRLGVEDSRIRPFSNGVVLPSRDEVIAQLGRRTGRRLVNTGRMVADKDVALVFDAAVQLLREGVDLDLVFVGDGPERVRLEDEARAQALGTCVQFAGFRKDVYAELLGADFFVSASVREGQSNSLLEAMACGVIPIVRNASGVADVVSHGETGFIVEGGAAEDLTRAVQEALALPTDRRVAMSIAARDFAEQSLSIDAVARMTIDAVQRARARDVARH